MVGGGLKRIVYSAGISCLVFSIFARFNVAHATINSCSAQVDQHFVSPGSEVNFNFQVTNTDSNPINWIKITRPSSDFRIAGASAPPWTRSTTDDDVTLTGSSIDPGSTYDQINLDIIVANNQTPALNWTVQVSDSADGTNPAQCSGNLSTTIGTQSVPTISKVSVSNISPNSVTITWDTDVESTSQINYGLDDSYGQSTLVDSSLVANHSVVLTGLNPNTGYHFQIVSTAADGGSASSGDSTFLTALEQGTVTKTITLPGLAIQVTNPADKTPPTIALMTSLPKVVQSFPDIKGTATDDSAVVRVEYSTDGGQNWLPVDSAPALGSKSVQFSFTPTNLDDGNYTILARAIDAGGNVAVTPAQTVVVDRLPPLVGGQIISLGPQVLVPDSQGNLSTVAGLDEKITLSAVGGATSINLSVKSTNPKLKTTSFSLTQSPDTGLWSGILSFGQAGTYSLTANAVDGAGNKTSRTLSTVQVLPAGKIVQKGTGQAIQNAKLTVYYLEPESNAWVVWDGAAYGQQNPQTADKNGNFTLMLPPGKYYLKAAAKGYRQLVSDIFEFKQPTPVSAQLKMSKRGFSIPWLDFSTQKISLNTASTAGAAKNPLLDQTAPDFSLKDNSGNPLRTIDLLGKPTDLIFLSTWTPTASQQLSALSTLQTNKDINVEPVALQENAGRVNAYDAISGYSLSWLVDPDSTTTSIFALNSLPTHYFVDRNGTVKKIVSGVLTNDEILSNLSGL